MNTRETRDIYDCYYGSSEESTVDYLDADSQKYLDNSIIPACKSFGASTNGIRHYLASQGITDPNYIQYINSKID